MATHTLGPWTWDPYGYDLRGPQGSMVLSTSKPSEGPSDANARLIAAAPELLSVTRGAWHLCQALLAGCDGPTDVLLRAVANALHAMIAKAEGG